MRFLPDDLRDLLKEPIGDLVDEKQLLKILDEKEFYKGRWWDTLIFAILEDEWKNRP